SGDAADKEASQQTVWKVGALLRCTALHFALSPSLWHMLSLPAAACRQMLDVAPGRTAAHSSVLLAVSSRPSSFRLFLPCPLSLFASHLSAVGVVYVLLSDALAAGPGV